VSFATAVNGGNDLIVTAGTGTVSFTELGTTTPVGTVDVTGGTVNFGGTVTLAATETLTVTNSGLWSIGNYTITAPGGITQDGVGLTMLTGDATLNTTNSNVSFATAIDGGSALIVGAGTGTVTFNGAIGATTDLSSLSVTAATITQSSTVETTGNVLYTGAPSIGGNITTTTSGTFTATGATTLAANVVINTSANNQNISFNSTLNTDGTAHTLGLTAGTGDIVFTGAVGATNAPGAVTVNSAGDVTISNAFTAASLAITQTGTFIKGATGALTVAGGFSTNGNLTLSNNISTTNSSITLTGTVTLGGDVELSVGTGTVTLATVAVGTNTLTVTADGIDFVGGEGSITGTGDILLQPSTVATSIGIAGAAGTLGISAADIAALANGFNLITIGRAEGTGAITIDAVTFNDPVTIRSPGVGGSITVEGQITGANGASITLEGPGATTTLNANIVTSGTAITINDTVVLGTPVAILLDTTNGGASAAGADITITGAVNDNTEGTSTFTLTAGTGGAVTLAGIGGTTPIGALAITGNTVNLGGAVTVAAGDTITITNGGVWSIGNYTITAPGGITQDGVGLTTLSGDATLATTNSAVSLGGQSSLEMQEESPGHLWKGKSRRNPPVPVRNRVFPWLHRTTVAFHRGRCLRDGRSAERLFLNLLTGFE